ncbi:hypothetical protein O1611_g3221 [Lasiodiplodia mahajangana]|uniref:Uncharacterized protein n=1 Tax=Lasiodiplodia mahajangana TaxID=1108764 RepID=A0ACC2JSL3_9PEZI|nr:hypothetical protein O1611_g3221 [Lasiodiplodia mahajangana]
MISPTLQLTLLESSQLDLNPSPPQMQLLADLDARRGSHYSMTKEDEAWLRPVLGFTYTIPLYTNIEGSHIFPPANLLVTMRVSYFAAALCAVGASAGILPTTREVETRQDSAGTWYLVGFNPDCGSFGCNVNYAVFGAENAVPGAPAFGLHCNTWGSCANAFPGSDADAKFAWIVHGPLTITQKFTTGGKNMTASAVVDWDGQNLVAFKIPVTVTEG